MALRVYSALLRNPHIFGPSPQRTPAWSLAQALRVKPRNASRALKLLIERGYVIEHDRPEHADGDRARYVTVPMQRAVRDDSPTTGPQKDLSHPASDRSVT
jgi:hypothetical protein